MSLPEHELDLAPTIIDHPAHPGWLASGMEIVKVDAKSPVPETFEPFGRSAKRVMHALNVASRRTDSARAVHEQQNLTKLLLTPEEHQEYLQLAGKPAEALNYMRWFAPRANEAYTHLSYLPNVTQYTEWLDRGRKLGKISLELFGQRQAGKWNTQVVDTLARKVPEILQAHIGARIKTYDDPEHPRLLGHYFIPLYHRPGERGSNFEFGTVRRRRMLADVVLDGVKIELFKESTGVLVLRNLPPDKVKALTEPYADLMKRDENDLRDSPPAKEAGRIFAEAIRCKATDTTVVPMSIQDIMMVRAPEAVLKMITKRLTSDQQSKKFD